MNEFIHKGGDKKKFAPEEVSAMILGKMRTVAGSILDNPPKNGPNDRLRIVEIYV